MSCNFVDALHQGEVDIASACFSITKERSEVVDFLPPWREESRQLFLKNPADSYHWKAYVEPLTPLCWVAILLFITITPPILAGILFYGRY